MVTRRASDGLQLSPVSVIAGDEGEILTSSSRVTAKVRNLRRDPRVALCVVDDSFFGPWLAVEGQATVVELPEAWELLKQFHLRRDGGIPGYDGSPAAGQRLLATWEWEQKVLVRIKPERVTTAPSWEDMLAAVEAASDREADRP
ncbi:hypothetical protein GCM10022222_58940 [Amycolatopsis ultiminotia]|uniref:Pyridoxamine 5'-phosphate oxidase N-terminal domain-containing protein n=2 Tax=Amycolatopsis ultiminotia TaxID=543629 RepID=A0ABP6XJ82_9PSEU